LSPEEAYTRRFLSIFEAQRKALTSRKSDKKHNLDLGFRNTYTSFLAITHKFTPEPSHLVALQRETVLQMLHIASQVLKRRKNLSKRYSEWVWGLLCKLGDVGTLDSDAVSVVRELGKKAVWVGIGYIGAEEADATAVYDEDDDEDEDEEGGGVASGTIEQYNNGIIDYDEEEPVPSSHVQGATVKVVQPIEISVPGRRRNTSSPEPPSLEIQSLSHQNTSSHSVEVDMEVARVRLLTQLACVPPKKEEEPVSTSALEGVDEETCPDANTRATIDMIITIAGEVYGQRDLLEFRSAWGGLWG